MARTYTSNRNRARNSKVPIRARLLANPGSPVQHQTFNATSDDFYMTDAPGRETLYQSQGPQGKGMSRPSSAIKFHDQQVLMSRLAIPKRKEIPFHKFLITTERENIAKRKLQYQNRLFSCN